MVFTYNNQTKQSTNQHLGNNFLYAGTLSIRVGGKRKGPAVASSPLSVKACIKADVPSTFTVSAQDARSLPY
jgi:hypothetical protein